MVPSASAAGQGLAGLCRGSREPDPALPPSPTQAGKPFELLGTVTSLHPKRLGKNRAKVMRISFPLQDVLNHASGKEQKGHAAASLCLLASNSRPDLGWKQDWKQELFRLPHSSDILLPVRARTGWALV